MGDADRRYILLSMSAGDYSRFMEGCIPSGVLDATFFNRGTYDTTEVAVQLEQAATNLFDMRAFIKRQIGRS